MGLTIHYRLRTRDESPQQVRELISRLRQQALDLPFSRVGEVVELTGKDCDYEQRDRDDPNRWLLIQAREYVERPAKELGHRYHYDVLPTHVIAFETEPGDGCESANFGLCRYPWTIQADGSRIRTGLSGWRWGSFCKTQYASNPERGGVANFLRCHLLVVRMLDHARELGILDQVHDEGGFWDGRDVQALARAVGQWNEMIAAAAGKLKDQLGPELMATIAAFPNFEHLEAAGRGGECNRHACP
jgi:hypothetical protein